MISDIYKVFIDFGDGLTLWDAQYKNFEKTEVMHKKLKGADNYCTFILTPSITLANKLRGIGRPGALVSITKNEAPWFYGYIRKTFSLKKVSRLEPVKIEAVSPSFRLKRKIREAIYFQEFTVSNPVSPATSIIHTLFTRAGVPLERIDMPVINYSVPVYYIEENTATWYALIEEVLYQYEYIIDFDVFGRAIARKMTVASLLLPSAVFGSGKSGNINGSIESIVREEERDIIEVEWAELEVLENVVVFSDTTGAAPTKKASIMLAPFARYGNDDGSGMYAELSVEGKELVYATGCTLDCAKDEDIFTDIFEAFPKRVRISLHNRNTVFPREITKLDIKASWATVKKAVNKSKVVNADTEYSETKKISANRIHSKEAAGALCSALAWYYKYSDHTYKFSSSLDVAIGFIVSVTDSEIGTVDARVIQKKEDATSSLFSYELEAIADFVPSFSTHEYFAEEREKLPRKDYDEAVQAIADKLLELSQGDIDFRLDLEAVRNGDIIDGAIKRAALESEIQNELEAFSGFSATISQIIQENDRINLLVKESREDSLERLDEAVMSLQAGIMISSQEVRLGVQNVEAQTQALLSVQSDRIEAMVKGGGSSAYLSMSVTIPATIDALTRNRMIAAVGAEQINAVYELTAGGFWYVRPSASSLAIKALKDSLRTAGLLGSQITLDADEILMGGRVKAKNIDVDDLNAWGTITVGLSGVTGLTEISNGKIKTDLLDIQNILGENAVFRGSLQASSGLFSGSIESGPLELNVSPPSNSTFQTTGVLLVSFIDQLIASGIRQGGYVCSGSYNGREVDYIEFGIENKKEELGQVETTWYYFWSEVYHIDGQGSFTRYWSSEYAALWEGTRNKKKYFIKLSNKKTVLYSLIDETGESIKNWVHLSDRYVKARIVNRPDLPASATSPSSSIPPINPSFTCSSGNLSFTSSAFTMRMINLPAYSASLPTWTTYLEDDGAGNYTLKVKK